MEQLVVLLFTLAADRQASLLNRAEPFIGVGQFTKLKPKLGAETRLKGGQPVKNRVEVPLDIRLSCLSELVL
ncbi:hypothetical protein [Paracoccus shanxieyensis]|uniref:Uncharacterized protein n=1 Tax=Paracoccus shanxieyensis TaxID=2675752 RepID=A0A6L6J1C8_9RHOB|nr:hypothetical protein [Paracoccus shanxieyensis]MTH66545.1 hypothetical protein [Paracoccus shanxieyensis]MTH89787.1 hypothetical protein [Paracoccus shanxieyensis]